MFNACLRDKLLRQKAQHIQWNVPAAVCGLSRWISTKLCSTLLSAVDLFWPPLGLQCWGEKCTTWFNCINCHYNKIIDERMCAVQAVSMFRWELCPCQCLMGHFGMYLTFRGLAGSSAHRRKWNKLIGFLCKSRVEKENKFPQRHVQYDFDSGAARTIYFMFYYIKTVVMGYFNFHFCASAHNLCLIFILNPNSPWSLSNAWAARVKLHDHSSFPWRLCEWANRQQTPSTACSSKSDCVENKSQKKLLLSCQPCAAISCLTRL